MHVTSAGIQMFRGGQKKHADSLSQEGAEKCPNVHLPQSLGSLEGVECEGPDPVRD